MQKRGGGAIINIGSMWALNAIAATPCSGSSTAKGAVHALTKNLAIEFAPDKIRVNAIAPAVVETPLFDSVLTKAPKITANLPKLDAIAKKILSKFFPSVKLGFSI